MAEKNPSGTDQNLDPDDALKDLEKNYDNVNHPISFLSPQKIYVLCQFSTSNRYSIW